MKFTVRDTPVFATTGGRPFDASHPVLLFLHGAGMDHTVWALQTRYFAHHGWAVLALDFPGHGHSGGEALPSIEAMAEWIPEVLETLGVPAASLVGHSMGSLVALEAAARFPEQIRQIALLGTAAQMPVHPDLLAAAQANQTVAQELITSWAHGRAGHLGGVAVPGLSLLGGGKALLGQAPAGVLGSDLAACNAYASGLERAAAVSCPALCLLGAEDKMTPAREGTRLGKTFPQGTVEVLAGSGHMMMLEAPDATLDVLRSWLQP